MKKMLRMQGVPEAQIEIVLNMMEKDPELFKKISQEIKEKIDSGMDQMQAGMQVMKKYEADLKKLV